MNTPALEILQPGPLSSIQDRGRLGHQHLGVPVSGAVDPDALRIGNILVGNDPFAACVEITLGKFQARFLHDTVFALTGPNTHHALLNHTPIPTWRALTARKGQILRLTQPLQGLRDYLLLRGGVQVPLVMGSSSTYLRGKFGGHEGRALRAGDVLYTGQARGHYSGHYPQHLIPRYSPNPELRVVLGPQDDAFSQISLHTFANSPYLVTDRTDRTGCRLSGPPILHEAKADIISDGLALGAIQVPGNGQPLILLADRPTTGGYAKIATVVSVDIPLIAQAMPGSKVKFKIISLYEARELYLHREFAVRRFAAGMETGEV